MPDLKVINHDSLFIVKPLNDEARCWLTEHTDAEASWFAGGLVVESRYLEPLLSGAKDDNLEVV